MRSLPRSTYGRGADVRFACALVVAGLMCVALAAPTSANERPALRYGYAVPAPGASGVSEGASYTCKPPVEPMVDMSGLFIFYQPSSTMSVIDREAMARYVKRNASVERFKAELLRMQVELIAADAARPAIADCLRTWLETWAASGALLSQLESNTAIGHRQAVLIQIWACIAASNAFATSASTLGPGDRRADDILAWLARLADGIVAEFTPVSGRIPSLRWLESTGNQSHWAALAVAQVAVLRQDRARLAWALDELERALVHADAEGSFPNEMRRGGKAVHYQNFAMLPLSLLVTIADANGMPLRAVLEQRLQSVAAFSLAAVRSPDAIAKRVGQTQEIGADALDWAEVLSPHMQTTAPELAKDLNAAMQARRPARSAFIGLAISDVDFSSLQGRGPH